MIEILKILGQLVVTWFAHKLKRDEERKKELERLEKLQEEVSVAIKERKDNVRSKVTSFFVRSNRD